VNIKNYTTTISAHKSIQEIESILMKFGAREIMKQVENNQYSTLLFTIIIDNKKVPFKLPIYIQSVQEFITKEYNNNHSRTQKKIADFQEQAYNIAWRVMKDWIHAQLSIIETGMCKPEQILMPYLYLPAEKRTLSEKFLSGELIKSLPAFEE
jgi:hypothetical protein